MRSLSVEARGAPEEGSWRATIPGGQRRDTLVTARLGETGDLPVRSTTSAAA
jgi:hypothetical protein